MGFYKLQKNDVTNSANMAKNNENMREIYAEDGIETVSEKFTKFGMRLGESFLSIHIPKGEPLDIDECKKSLAMARDFFAK